MEVVKKDIKNLHLSVYPPAGRVRISAPLRMNLDNIRVFAISKLGWIRQQQNKLREQERETPREYLDRESHYVWGKRYLLEVIESDDAPGVELQHSQMCLRVRPGAGNEKKQAMVEEWYREQVKQSVPSLIAKWEPLIGVTVERFFAPQCLEYIVVHEMVHLLEPTHNNRFTNLMDQFMPHWRFCRAELNRLPVRHHDWAY